MDAKKVLKKSAWVLLPLAFILLICWIGISVGRSDSVDGSKRIVDATLNEIAGLLIVHAILTGVIGNSK